MTAYESENRMCKSFNMLKPENLGKKITTKNKKQQTCIFLQCTTSVLLTKHGCTFCTEII